MRRTKMRWKVAGLLVSLLLILAAWPVYVYSQTSSLRQLLSGSDVPTTIKAKDLTAEYRVVKAGDNMELTIMQMRMFDMNPLTALGGVYYTKGDTVKINDITYLIGYRATEDPQELQRRMRDHDPGDNPFEPRKLVAGETLTLSLLNLRTAGSLNDVRAFDPTKDVMSDAEAKALQINGANQKSVKNLRQLGLALRQYLQDYDETLPPMTPATSFEQIKQFSRTGLINRSTPVHVVLQPYMRNLDLVRHPVTKEIYRPNQSLSFKTESEFDRTYEIAAFYEASPAPDGTRAVAYLDGHVRREQETNWPRIREASGIGPNGQPLQKKVPASRAQKISQADATSVRNLKQIGLALLQYVQDYDETIPPMRPATSFRQIQQGIKAGNNITRDTPVQVRIFPYLKAQSLFRHPVTKDIYRPNQSLSEKPG